MRIAVMGAGAVGGYFGAKLALGGHDVVFIARGQHLDAIYQNGLRVKSPDGEMHVSNARSVADPAQAGNTDLVLLCVKSYDTEIAAQALQPVIGDNTVILSLQNGVDNAEKIAHLFGAGRTLGGVVYVGAQVIAPGVIEHSTGGRIIFGSTEMGDGGTIRAVEQALSAAGIPCEQCATIQQAQWRKLLWNAPFCAISCLTGATVKDIVESEPLTNLALGCMEEVRQAAITRNVDLPTQLFAETISFSKNLGAFKPSMLQDLEARKPLEYEAFNGIVVKLSSAAGKDAPINRVFYGALQYLDDKFHGEASS